MNKIICFLFLLIIFTLAPNKVFATLPEITLYPTTILVEREYVVEATMSGLSKEGIYRLRLVLAEPGTSKYFGSTWNESRWYNGYNDAPSPIDYKQFYTITTYDS